MRRVPSALKCQHWNVAHAPRAIGQARQAADRQTTRRSIRLYRNLEEQQRATQLAGAPNTMTAPCRSVEDNVTEPVAAGSSMTAQEVAVRASAHAVMWPAQLTFWKTARRGRKMVGLQGCEKTLGASGAAPGGRTPWPPPQQQQQQYLRQHLSSFMSRGGLANCAM